MTRNFYYKSLFIYTCNLSQNSGGTTGTQKALTYFKNRYNTDIFNINCLNSKIDIFKNAIFGYLKCNKKSKKKLDVLIAKNKYDILYFDDSVNGKVVKYIKNKYPDKFIIVNFHNDETKYYRDIYKSKGILYLPLFWASKKNQKNALKFSDYRIYITETDKEQIGENTHNYTIIPAMLKDSFDGKKNQTGEYFLFFGFSFYANVEAAMFILKEIAPRVAQKIVIAGKGMDEALKNEECPPNVKIIGFVEDLNQLFANAIAFICPIFTGSGMKVKIVDALMRGKTIICTDFAAIGYDKQNEVFKICNTADEYVDIINKTNNSYNEYSRQLYCNKYDIKNIQKYYEVINDAFLRYKEEVL